LLLSGDREYANEQLVKFSRLIRKTLELSALPSTNIEGEIAYLTEYMELEQLRMPGQFDFYFHVSDEVDLHKAKLPNMMLQPIIENCIRHGIKHLQNRKGRIEIDITKNGNCLNCSITDNGVGRESHSAIDTLISHKSYGMDIIRKRLKGVKGYDPKQHFMKIIDLKNDHGQSLGTQVIIQLPYTK
jgi:LytS/YehU family sensor histidine kinase